MLTGRLTIPHRWMDLKARPNQNDGNIFPRERIFVNFIRMRWHYLLILACLTAGCVGCAGDPEFRKGKEQEAAKNFDQATINFKKALDKNPTNLVYRLYYDRVRLKAGIMHYDNGQRMEKAQKYPEALAEYQQAYTIDPSNDVARDDYIRLKGFLDNPNPAKQFPEVQSLLKENETNPTRAVELSPATSAPITLRISDTGKRVYETISKLAGINVVFDPDYERASAQERLTVELNNVTLLEALEIMQIKTRTFWKPLNANTLLVIPDNQSKRRDFEDQVIKTIYLSNSLAATDLTETVNALRQLLTLRNIVQSNALNAIIIRDTPDKVAIAERIVQSIDKAKPEVLIDVAVLEVDRDRIRDLGISPFFGSSAGLGAAASFNNALTGGASVTGGTTSGTTTGTTTTTSTSPGTVPINRLGHIAGGSFSIAIPSATAQALLSDTSARVLQNPQLRASDGKLAKIRIGQKVPISTGSFTPFTGGGATAGNIFSQFQYQDVGVNLDVTPKVHLDREITLTVKVEISSIAGQQNFNGLLEPIFNNRSVEHEITLKEGEANVLAGIISDDDRKVVSGVPGLSQIPILRFLFSNEHTERNSQEFIIVMTPHIVRLPEFEEINMRGLYVGTDTVIQFKSKVPRLGEVAAAQPAVAQPGANQPAAPQPQPTPPKTQPQVPTVPPQAAVPPPSGATPQGPVAGAAFRINPPTSTVPIGKPFMVTVNVDNVQNLYACTLALAWDPRVMRLKDATEAGLLGRDEEPIALVQRPDNDAGTVVITLSRPPEAGAVNGSGSLVTLSFEPVAVGTTTLAFSQLFPRDPGGGRIPATSSTGQIVIK
jgi:general secretion pathway protein D